MIRRDEGIGYEGHNVVDLYRTGFGGVQSKYCWQSCSIDALCIVTVNDVECLLLYSFNTITAVDYTQKLSTL